MTNKPDSIDWLSKSQLQQGDEDTINSKIGMKRGRITFYYLNMLGLRLDLPPQRFYIGSSKKTVMGVSRVTVVTDDFRRDSLPAGVGVETPTVRRK